jgi:hypothetical protein
MRRSGELHRGGLGGNLPLLTLGWARVTTRLFRFQAGQARSLFRVLHLLVEIRPDAIATPQPLAARRAAPAE